MTDSDLRELDGWIAEKFMGGMQTTLCEVEEHSIDFFSGYCATCHIDFPSQAEKVAPAFSTNLSAFALVKREIERRFWDWRSTQRVYFEPHFRFEVLTEHDWKDACTAEENSEELAGCLAVKAAVETSSSITPTQPTTPSVQSRTMLD